MDKDTTEFFKTKLQGELTLIEDELKSLGWKDPQTGDWEASVGDFDPTATESDEIADRLEDYDENRAEIEEIEIHWRAVKRALEKIAQGTYGVCEIAGEAIERDRLDANPSARTCKAHLADEDKLPL